jgi:hypothetical protein
MKSNQLSAVAQPNVIERKTGAEDLDARLNTSTYTCCLSFKTGRSLFT